VFTSSTVVDGRTYGAFQIKNGKYVFIVFRPHTYSVCAMRLTFSTFANFAHFRFPYGFSLGIPNSK
jgi:hypothetical protein